MRHGSVPSRQLVPRILHLLAFDNKDNVVGRLLESTRGVPLWLWLAWIPQLLLGLQHPEKDICKRLLLQIATAFPQVDCLCIIAPPPPRAGHRAHSHYHHPASTLLAQRCKQQRAPTKRAPVLSSCLPWHRLRMLLSSCCRHVLRAKGTSLYYGTVYHHSTDLAWLAC